MSKTGYLPQMMREIQDSLHVRLLMLNAITIDKWWNYRDVCSNFWRLYYSGSDGAFVRWSGRKDKILPHRVYLIPGWVQFSCHAEKTVRHLFIHFDVSGLSGPRVRRWFDRPLLLAADPVLSKIAASLRTLLKNEKHHDPETIFTAKALTQLSLAAFIRYLSDNAQRQTFHQELMIQNPVSPAISYIHQHPDTPIRNHQLAQQCHMSEDYFIRIFHEYVGQTPAHYAMERRIVSSAENLLYSNASIKQIAAAHGFLNRYHFSRVFTRFMGIPPAAYRKRGQLI